MKTKTDFLSGPKLWITLLLLAVASLSAFSQTTIPYQIVNNSPDFTDDQIYIGLVGRTAAMGGVWIDFAANDVNAPALRKIQASDNTVHKTPTDWGYASSFTKLSEIKNKTLHIPMIGGCRLFIGFKSPLYLHFFDNDGGYAGPDLQNSNDPNYGIRWELIELTWGNVGLWVNTSRVDAYQYPMGLEIWGKPGSNNAYMKTGEMLPHKTIINRFQTAFPSGDFKPCYRSESFPNDPLGGIIEQPSKLPSFKEGGASKDYFQNYIDRIWAYYTTNELVVGLGDRGTYRGKVENGALKMVGPGGVQAWISAKPNTQEVIEAKGVIAQDVAATPDKDADLAFQAQFCAALNRGIIDLKIPGGQPQIWNDVTKFYVTDTYNKYVWFFHQPDITFGTKTYAFAYDDVFDQSSTLQSSNPDRVKITIGGFYVPEYTPVLTTLNISPKASLIGVGVEQQFVASGLDQKGNYMSTSPVWSATGGTINASSGVFSATSANTYTVTAKVGALTASTTISVSVPILTTITVSPNAPTLKIGVSQTFTAVGKDQNGNIMTIAPVWSATGGTINPTTGAFYANSENTYDINASVGAIKGIARVTVTPTGPPPQGCELTTPSGDFTVLVSGDKTNPTITFVPSAKATGIPTCLLFYTVSATPPNWGTVGARAAVANTPFRITAAQGEKVYYYYVYSLSAGGQGNSMASNDNFVVGSCTFTGLNDLSNQIDVKAFPNPVTNSLNVTFDGKLFYKLSIHDLSGKLVFENELENDQNEIRIDFEKFSKGFYTLIMTGYTKSEVLKIIKR